VHNYVLWDVGQVDDFLVELNLRDSGKDFAWDQPFWYILMHHKYTQSGKAQVDELSELKH